MSGVPEAADPSPLVDRLCRLAHGRRRVLVGVVGPPGAGKSTLVSRVLAAADGREELRGAVARVPMDGFHLANAELDRLGLRGRKGAPETFDAAGYVALLRRLREVPPETVYAPDFDHALQEPVAGSIPVPPDVRVVLTEGNYLLHTEGVWAQVAGLLDEVWFCRLPGHERRERLLRRHVASGRAPDDAAAWVRATDEPNALLVGEGAGGADLVLEDGRVTADRGGPAIAGPAREDAG